MQLYLPSSNGDASPVRLSFELLKLSGIGILNVSGNPFFSRLSAIALFFLFRAKEIFQYFNAA